MTFFLAQPVAQHWRFFARDFKAVNQLCALLSYTWLSSGIKEHVFPKWWGTSLSGKATGTLALATPPRRDSSDLCLCLFLSFFFFFFFSFLCFFFFFFFFLSSSELEEEESESVSSIRTSSCSFSAFSERCPGFFCRGASSMMPCKENNG